jgi:copper chaperone CopZ
MKSVILKIGGMRCGGCAQTIEALLKAEAGVCGAEVSYDIGQARVLYDPKATSEERLAAAVARAGYSVATAAP